MRAILGSLFAVLLLVVAGAASAQLPEPAYQTGSLTSRNIMVGGPGNTLADATIVGCNFPSNPAVCNEALLKMVNGQRLLYGADRTDDPTSYPLEIICSETNFIGGGVQPNCQYVPWKVAQYIDNYYSSLLHRYIAGVTQPVEFKRSSCPAPANWLGQSLLFGVGTPVVVSQGAGYAVGDQLILSGGVQGNIPLGTTTTVPPGTQATTIYVTSVNGSGGITGINMMYAGAYTSGNTPPFTGPGSTNALLSCTANNVPTGCSPSLPHSSGGSGATISVGTLNYQVDCPIAQGANVGTIQFTGSDGFNTTFAQLANILVSEDTNYPVVYSGIPGFMSLNTTNVGVLQQYTCAVTNPQPSCSATMTANQTVYTVTQGPKVYIPSLPVNGGIGPQPTQDTATTGTAPSDGTNTLTIYDNNGSNCTPCTIGTISFAQHSTTGTITIPTQFVFQTGDTVYIVNNGVSGIADSTMTTPTINLQPQGLDTQWVQADSLQQPTFVNNIKAGSLRTTFIDFSTITPTTPYPNGLFNNLTIAGSFLPENQIQPPLAGNGTNNGYLPVQGGGTNNVPCWNLFSGCSWTKFPVNTTITQAGSPISPDGTADMWLVTAVSNGGQINQTITLAADTLWRWSVAYCQPGTAGSCILGHQYGGGGAGYSTVLNPVQGAVSCTNSVHAYCPPPILLANGNWMLAIATQNNSNANVQVQMQGAGALSTGNTWWFGVSLSNGVAGAGGGAGYSAVLSAYQKNQIMQTCMIATTTNPATALPGHCPTGVNATTFSELLATPASSTDTCTTGQFEFDTSYLYVCYATNAWKRVTMQNFLP
jgi:hypothetical protein